MKRWWKSRTVWFNLAIILVTTATELAPLIDLLDESTQPTVRAVLLVVSSVGNMILRSVTSTKVTL